MRNVELDHAPIGDHLGGLVHHRSVRACLFTRHVHNGHLEHPGVLLDREDVRRKRSAVGGLVGRWFNRRVPGEMHGETVVAVLVFLPFLGQRNAGEEEWERRGDDGLLCSCSQSPGMSVPTGKTEKTKTNTTIVPQTYRRQGFRWGQPAEGQWADRGASLYKATTSND
jgi:hypothetical protein